MPPASKEPATAAWLGARVSVSFLVLAGSVGRCACGVRVAPCLSAGNLFYAHCNRCHKLRKDTAAVEPGVIVSLSFY